MSLSGGSDTSDLLGGFEQQDPERAVQVPSVLSSYIMNMYIIINILPNRGNT